jgi:ubiquinone/menaquinone biosynthesis C-methylase UbiE
MGWYERNVVPRIVELMCGNSRMQAVRRPALEGLEGEVLEVGFGSGPNVPLYPPAVTKVYAVDPSMTGRKLAAKRLAATEVPVEFVGLDGESIPLDDESVDNALSTFTLCTIPDVERALHEVRRVLRPGGRLFFLEHGLDPDPKVEKWQHRLTPIQRRVAGGCHLDRDIRAVVSEAGLEVEKVANFSLQGPKSFGYMYCGTARKVA